MFILNSFMEIIVFWGYKCFMLSVYKWDSKVSYYQEKIKKQLYIDYNKSFTIVFYSFCAI